MIWATVSSQSCFCWLYRVSPSLAAKTVINLILVLTTNLLQRFLDTHGQVQGSLLWGHWSFLLGPGAHRFCLSPARVCFPSPVKFLMALWWSEWLPPPRGLMPYPGLLHPEPLWQATADPYLHKRPSNTFLAHSLWGLWVLMCTRFVWALQTSLAGMEFDFQHDFAPPTIFLGLLLCPWMWGIFFGGIQHSPVNGCSAANCNFGVLTGALIKIWGDQLYLHCYMEQGHASATVTIWTELTPPPAHHLFSTAPQQFPVAMDGVPPREDS